MDFKHSKILYTSSEKFTTKFIVSVNSSFRGLTILMSNLSLSCCRARLLSHSQVHRQQQLTNRNNSTNQAPNHDSLLVITYKQFIFPFLSRSSSQTHNLTIKTHTHTHTVFEHFPSCSTTCGHDVGWRYC